MGVNVVQNDLISSGIIIHSRHGAVCQCQPVNSNIRYGKPSIRNTYEIVKAISHMIIIAYHII
jgi:hypothetical protein